MTTPDTSRPATPGASGAPTPYYQDDLVTLYHGDCRKITAWLDADVLLTDTPYGREATQRVVANRGTATPRSKPSRSRRPIVGDDSTALRDAVVEAWGTGRRAVLFGDGMLARPAGVKLVGAYLKPRDAGFRGALGGMRRDLEDLYFLGPWPTGLGGRSSLFTTAARSTGGQYGLAKRSGHRHAKPLDVLAELLELLGPGVAADPCAGSGNHLIAARLAGRRAIGVEREEMYCENIARRLSNELALGGIR